MNSPPKSTQADIADCAPARAVLEQLHLGLAECLAGGQATPVFMQAFDAETKGLILEALGEGDIQVELDANERHPFTRVRETQLTGVWHLRMLDTNGDLLDEHLAVGDCPPALRERPFEGARTRIGWPSESDDAQAPVNATAVFAELDAHLDQHAGGSTSATFAQHPPQQFNLSMTPQTPEDLELIERHLGCGPARMVNLGYGRCQIEATAVRSIWRLRHFSDAGHLLLDALEISPVPSIILATAEDLADSQVRLGDLLETLGSH